MSCHHSHHNQCIKEALSHAETHCVEKGLRFTELRRKVFELLWKSHKALTASDIMQVLGKDQPPLTYRALDFLKEQKLIHHIASINAYIGCIHPAEQHVSQLFVCEKCREVAEIDATSAMASLKNTAHKNGFAIQQTFIEILGLCVRCQTG